MKLNKHESCQDRFLFLLFKISWMIFYEHKKGQEDAQSARNQQGSASAESRNGMVSRKNEAATEIPLHGGGTASEINDRTDRFAFVHQIKGIVDFIQGHGVGHKRSQLNFTCH